MAEAVAKQLGIQPTQVLTASTGVIGKPLEIEKIEAAVPDLVDRATEVADGFALAILTTDLVPKSVSDDGQACRRSSAHHRNCKGSGMIHPQMATMLGYILTDEIESDSAKALMREAPI